MIRDPLTGELALAGTTRSERPNEFRHGPEDRCAFCPGNEDLTPPEIARIGTAEHWSVRVFANKYPAIVPPDGDHEVIVDSPEHEQEVTRDGLSMWRERYRAALNRMPNCYPVIFKNSGAYAGATIVHPHTQLVMLPQRPQRWEPMSSGRTCCACAERTRAQDNGTIVAGSDRATAFVRDGSRFSSLLTILPHECAISIDRASDDVWDEAGALAMHMVHGLKKTLRSDSAFNVIVYSDSHAKAGAFHWFFELVPRLNTLAGFELSTGIFIRGATAQESAGRWRRMIAPPDGSL